MNGNLLSRISRSASSRQNSDVPAIRHAVRLLLITHVLPRIPFCYSPKLCTWTNPPWSTLPTEKRWHMLNSMEARALHDQILAAYLDDAEESLPIFERLVVQATVSMSNADWSALCLAIGW